MKTKILSLIVSLAISGSAVFGQLSLSFFSTTNMQCHGYCNGSATV